jgi:hypothetical protein|tara:strand:+ start:367 stop:789 length:423 start_codon:yes stop_codon:yes gene_type:complete
MTALTAQISETFNAFADKAERLWDKAVVKTLDASESSVVALTDVSASFAKSAAMMLPIGAGLGAALYAGGGYNSVSLMGAMQGGSVVFGGFATMIWGLGDIVGTTGDEQSIGVRVGEKMSAYKEEYAQRNNVQIAQPAWV